MNSTRVPIRFGGSVLRNYRHVCAFFNSPEDEYRTLLPFIRDGLQLGDRAYHVMEQGRVGEHLARLRSAGIDVEKATACGQFELRIPEDTYLRGGRFAKESMLAVMQGVLESGVTVGFPLTRLIAHAEAVLDDVSNNHDWLEYESRLNQVLPAYNDVVICTYDVHRLKAGIAMDIMRTHPVAILGDIVQENPFFVPPDGFLRELDARAAAGEANVAG
jgi:hypothetical protein